MSLIIKNCERLEDILLKLNNNNYVINEIADSTFGSEPQKPVNPSSDSPEDPASIYRLGRLLDCIDVALESNHQQISRLQEI